MHDNLTHLLQYASWQPHDEARRLLREWLAEAYSPLVAQHAHLVEALLSLLRRDGWRAVVEVVRQWERAVEELPSWLPLGTAAGMLGVRPPAMRRWIRCGWLKAVMVWGEGYAVRSRQVVPLARLALEDQPKEQVP